MRRLSLRSTVALLCALAVVGALVAASVVSWLGMREAMRDQVDRSLAERGRSRIVFMPGGAPGSGQPPGRPDVEALCQSLPDMQAPELLRVQYLTSDDTTCTPGPRGAMLTPTPEEYAVADSVSDSAAADGSFGEVWRDAVNADGEHVRALTVPFQEGVAMTVTRSLEETDDALAGLALKLALVCLVGVVVAAAAGLFVARIALRPVGRLAGAAEHVAATDDLDVPIGDPERTGRDEVARLTRAFNAMMTRLAASRRRQQQLIADASHELRTPLTSLRTHVEWLMRVDDSGQPLDPAERTRVANSVLGQVEELTTLIGEISTLAREGGQSAHEPVDLDQAVLRAVERAQRRAPSRRFDLELEPWLTRGDPAGLERAVLNLLDNAVKFSAGPIRVRLEGGRVSVADDGPGLPEPDRAQAFDRFWRAASARELPGSGLGLAIVADCAERHGGGVFFTASERGGAMVGFTIPQGLTDFSGQPA